MQTKQKDILHTQDSANNSHNEESTSVHKPIPNTPFQMHCVDNKWFISLQKYRLIDPQDTEEEALQEMERTKWLIVLSIAAITHETLHTLNTEALQRAIHEQLEVVEEPIPTQRKPEA